MLGSSFDNFKDSVQKLEGDMFVEEIAHGVSEDHPGRFPFKRFSKNAFVNVKFVRFPLIGWESESSQSWVLPEHVAIVASGANLRAASGPVPGGFGPLYR